MTIIEFYDRAGIENIAGSILCNPERMILVGDAREKMQKSREVYRSILKKRGIKTEINCIYLDKNNLNSIVSILESIVTEYGDCIFDLTGGEELYLVGVGIIMEKYKSKVQCHRFNFVDNMLYDCDADGNVCSTAPFIFSIEENIGFYGGRLVTDPTKPLYTYQWSFSDEFLKDINLMWSICKKHTGQWNSQTSAFGLLFDMFADKDSLTVNYTEAIARDHFISANVTYNSFPWIISQLVEYKLIKYSNYYGQVTIEFKNSQIKRVLTTAGQLLEVYVASVLKSLKNNDGSPLYHDIIVGAIIDWDHDSPEEEIRTINEIDVIAMKGAIPVFISCKNGFFDVNELYKLNTVANRFGGKYVKRVLAASKSFSGNAKYSQLRSRMEDMNILFLDSISLTSTESFASILSSLWI
ncbi:MAG: DUF1887 family protein [Clostridia bacterium]|nr:DUF1887 family protein [Clostridia bacterium]